MLIRCKQCGKEYDSVRMTCSECGGEIEKFITRNDEKIKMKKTRNAWHGFVVFWLHWIHFIGSLIIGIAQVTGVYCWYLYNKTILEVVKLHGITLQEAKDELSYESFCYYFSGIGVYLFAMGVFNIVLSILAFITAKPLSEFKKQGYNRLMAFSVIWLFGIWISWMLPGVFWGGDFSYFPGAEIIKTIVIVLNIAYFNKRKDAFD